MLFYLDYYEVPHNKYNKSKELYEEKYKDLYNMLDELKRKVEKEGLTRREIDHIIWYCYKSYKAD